jgi:hypothetical protein
MNHPIEPLPQYPTGAPAPQAPAAPMPPQVRNAVRAPLAVAVRAWWPVIWLAGLAAVIFLWQSASTAYFKGPRQP